MDIDVYAKSSSDEHKQLTQQYTQLNQAKSVSSSSTTYSYNDITDRN